MKTKFFSICASLALAIGASSCVDLDTAPLNQKSDATMWQTPEDAEQGVSVLYVYLPSSMSQASSDVYTDNAVHGIKWAVSQQAHGVWNPTDYDWAIEYQYIRWANLVFANIDKVQGFTESQRNNVLGQAYFFRALIYSDLIRQFGDVPYTDQPMDLSEQEGIVREDWHTVYDKVMADFDQAITLLPEYTTDGRVNKQVARGFKAKTALYFANPECQHYVADGYQTAATATKAIIDSGHYGLYDEGYTGTAKDYTGHFEEMFWGLNMDNSNESLISVRNIASLNKGTNYIGFNCFPKLGWGGTNPTQSLVDTFEDCEGAPISESKIFDPLHPKANRDPRLIANVIFSGDEMYGVTVNTTPLPSSGDRALYPVGCGDATLTGYQTKKWLNPDVYPETEGWNHDACGSAMRFTEVLLMYAEALNEMSDRPQESLDAVNRVRARVGMPALQKTDASLPTYVGSQDALRQRIRNEFRVEFCFEGDHRQWDARRWNIATDVLNAPRYSYKYKIIEDPANALPGDNGQVCLLYVADGQQDQITNQVISYQPHNYVYPIPQSQIDLNPNLIQNPGY